MKTRLRLSFRRLKKIGFLWSFGLTLLVGLLLGFVRSSAGLWENEVLTLWLPYMVLGYVGHIGVLGLFIFQGWLPEKKTVPSLFPVMALGALVAYALIVCTLHTGLSTVNYYLLARTVVVVSVIVQFFLYPTDCYAPLLQLQQRWLAYRIKQKAFKPEAPYLLIESAQSRNVQIWISQLCLVQVNDHYLNYSYLEQGVFRELTAYGRLRDVQKQLGERFVQVDRSTLVNRTRIKGVEENATGAFLQLSFPEQTLPIPRSRLVQVKQGWQDNQKEE